MFLSTGYWHLGVGLGKGSEGIHKREESRVLHQDLLIWAPWNGPRK